MLRYAARSDVGLIRTNNEDAVYAGPRLLAIADGMGGHAAGDVASAVTIATLAPLDDDEPPADLLGALDRAIRQANDQLRQMMDADDDLAGMGTTLTAVLWAGNRIGLAHIGDSRAYLLRDGELAQITHDQTLVQKYVDEGQLDEADVPTHPQRSVLLRVLTGRPDDEADLSIRDVREGDRYLLCSDGLSSVVSKETLRETLQIVDPNETADALVDLALRSGAPDNVTCIVCDVVNAVYAERTATPEPVVGGSVAADADGQRVKLDSAAGRAAAALRTHRHPTSHRRTNVTGSVDDTPRRRWHGPVLVLGLIIVVAAALFGGTWWYSQNQYYVGSDGQHVVVYRGIKGDVLGISFSAPIEHTGIAVASLPPFERAKVDDTVSASSRHDADRIVAGLQRTTQSTGPAASGSPTATSLPTSSPSASSP